MYLIQDISIMFISIILEAFPFVVIGVALSSIIKEFISDDTLQKIIPKNPILGSIVGVLLGLFIPSCDCAVIPITRRLIKKGVPLNAAISFMLASPIVNPVVIVATVYSFSVTSPIMIAYRIIFGVIIAIVVGLLMGLLNKNNKLIGEYYKDDNKDNNFKKHSHNKIFKLKLDNDNSKTIDKKSIFFKKCLERLKNILNNSEEEFFEIIKYLIVGALIAAIVQILVPKTIILGLNNIKPLEILVLMLFAYIISLCSTSDSFVAKTFIGQISNSSILAFLLLGPMIDLKNTLMLTKSFNKKFTAVLISLIFACIFIVALVIKF